LRRNLPDKSSLRILLGRETMMYLLNLDPNKLELLQQLGRVRFIRCDGNVKLPCYQKIITRIWLVLILLESESIRRKVMLMMVLSLQCPSMNDSRSHLLQLKTVLTLTWHLWCLWEKEQISDKTWDSNTNSKIKSSLKNHQLLVITILDHSLKSIKHYLMVLELIKSSIM